MATRGKSQELARKRIIRKRGKRCEECGHESYVELHHKTAFVDGGDHGEQNIVLLCDACHRKAHGYKERKPGVAKWAEA